RPRAGRAARRGTVTAVPGGLIEDAREPRIARITRIRLRKIDATRNLINRYGIFVIRPIRAIRGSILRASSVVIGGSVIGSSFSSAMPTAAIDGLSDRPYDPARFGLAWPS